MGISSASALPNLPATPYGESLAYQPGIQAIEAANRGTKVTMEYETWLRLREFFHLV